MGEVRGRDLDVLKILHPISRAKLGTESFHLIPSTRDGILLANGSGEQYQYLLVHAPVEHGHGSYPGRTHMYHYGRARSES